MMYIKVDEDGNPVDAPIQHDNIRYILGKDDYAYEEVLALGMKAIKNYDQPMFDAEYQHAERAEIVKNEDGEIEQLWTVIEIDTNEKIRRWVLGPRQHKLIMSDWTQVSDAPISAEKRAEWAEFRAKLRNMTDDIDFTKIKRASEIEWPTPPGLLIPEEKWTRTIQ